MFATDLWLKMSEMFTKRANFIPNVAENFQKIKYLFFSIRLCENT